MGKKDTGTLVSPTAPMLGVMSKARRSILAIGKNSAHKLPAQSELIIKAIADNQILRALSYTTRYSLIHQSIPPSLVVYNNKPV